jgi:hypothetical protein
MTQHAARRRLLLTVDAYPLVLAGARAVIAQAGSVNSTQGARDERSP